jgi:hypothetical protein
MELQSLKDRTVSCFSVSAKSQNRIDVMLKWLSDLKTKKWNLIKLIDSLIVLIFCYLLDKF